MLSILLINKWKMRQQLREAAKMSVLLVTWWRRLGWEQIDTWQHPQTNYSCCMRKLPYFCGHVPQESGTRAGGSLSEKWPKIPMHANKDSHWRQLRLLILDLWTFWVNEVHKKIRWRRLAEVCFEWKKCWRPEIVQLF